MSTFIDGIAASENIDSSGERIIIAGLDCSSLEKDGVFNYEHKNDQPNQIVGKILKAKKIFTDADCEDERQLYYFKKCNVPYLYVMGELFDDYKDSARDIAGMFRYDADKKGQQSNNVMNFSIEGAKIEKVGMDIPRSIARKVTITVLPANKAAVAEMVPTQPKKKKDSLDNIFKTESGIEIELFKPVSGAELFEMKKAETANPKGTVLGTTGSGKEVFSHGRVGDYTNFSSTDHRHASEMHAYTGRMSQEAKLKDHHAGKAQLHLQAAGTAEKKEMRLKNAGPSKSVVKPSTKHLYTNIPGKRTMNKAMTAGSGMAAPSALEGGAALAPESIDKKIKKVGMEKSELLKRAEQAYNSWEKKEQFRAYMQKRMPKLAMGEIDAIGQTMALSKSLKAEKALAKMAGMEKSQDHSAFNQEHDHAHAVSQELDTKGKELGHTGSHFKYGVKSKGVCGSGFKDKDAADKFATHAKGHPAVHSVKQSESHGHHFVDVNIKTTKEMSGKSSELKKALKFGSEADQAATAKFVEEQKKNPPKNKEAKPKAPDLKSEVHSEVSHVEPMSHRTDEKYETVHLKSGHELHGHPKGKFKVGDKVTAKPHMMGTHLMEHRK